MSEWTGSLYGFYSNAPIKEVFSSMQKEASRLGYEFEQNSYNGEESLLFYKNKDMLDYHMEHGYNTDIEGEGCFCVEAKVVSLSGVASLFEFDGDSSFEPYDINFLFNKIYYYVLIVPDFIEKSAFSLKIYQTFVASVKIVLEK